MLSIKAFANEDDCYVAWNCEVEIAGCEGFALFRIPIINGVDGQEVAVNNRIDFQNLHLGASAAVSSVSSPIKRYSWVDHGVNTGDTVKYRVESIVNGQPNGNSALSNEVTLTSECGDGYGAFFNRGLVMSQFVSRIAKEDGFNPLRIKDQLAGSEQKLRKFMGGDLMATLVSILDGLAAPGNTDQIFLALYELSDNILVPMLALIGHRVHIVLTNGAEQPDENADARKVLTDAGCNVFMRHFKAGASAHNKFLVVTDSGGTPKLLQTGSANWQMTGMCTQINNIVVSGNKDLAQEYLNQWNRLKQAGDDLTPGLIASNDNVKVVNTGNSTTRLWFTATSDGQELEEAHDFIANAKSAVMFLMFMPGKSILLDAIAEQSQAGLYVRGVVSTIQTPNDTTNTVDAEVTLVERGPTKPQHLSIIQPEGIRTPLLGLNEEVTRSQFLNHGAIGFAIIHSKVVVIDPLGPEPIVITGSHNFSSSASRKNDENMLIIKGNRKLAEAYAVNIKSVYDHFRANAVAAEMASQGKNMGELFSDKLTWQAAYFKANNSKKQDREYWK